MSGDEKNVERRSFRISYVTGQGVEGSFEWDGAPVQVGRAAGGLVLPDPTVSSVHATFRMRAQEGSRRDAHASPRPPARAADEGGGSVLEIRDERSSAGVYVDDAKLPAGWQRLPLGTVAWLGESQLSVRVLDSGDDPTVMLSRSEGSPSLTPLPSDDWASSVLPSPPTTTPEATPVAARRQPPGNAASRAGGDGGSDERASSAEGSSIGADGARPTKPERHDDDASEQAATVWGETEPGSPTPASSVATSAAADDRADLQSSRAARLHTNAATAPAKRRRHWTARARITVGVGSLFALLYLWYVLLCSPPLP